MASPLYRDVTLNSIDGYISYETGWKLSGTIYLHRISDNRVGGAARKNFNVFKQICGEDTFRNVIVTTTMWDTTSPQVGQAREEELASDDRFYKTILDNGAHMVRYGNTTESARQILRLVIDNHPLPLHIQNQMFVENKEISQTDAAAELDRGLLELEQRYRKELEKAQEALERAAASKHQEMAQMFQQFKEEWETKIKQIEKEKKERKSAFTLLSRCKEKFKDSFQGIREILAETKQRREEARRSESRVDAEDAQEKNGSRARTVGLSVLAVAAGIFTMLLLGQGIKNADDEIQ